MGVDTSNASMVEQGFEAYKSQFGIVCPNSTATDVFTTKPDFNATYCLMTDSATSTDLAACYKT